MKTKNCKLRQPAGSEIAFIEIEGDRRKPEPEAVEIRFPWGSVGIVRATDTDRPNYWVHITRNHPRHGSFVPDYTEEGKIVDARLDINGKHASECDAGDFANPELYHVAVKIGPKD